MRYKSIFATVFFLSACAPSPQETIELPLSVVRYAAPSLTAKVVDTLPAGTSVYRLETEGDWLFVCYRGIRGWIQYKPSVVVDYIEKKPLTYGLLAEAPNDTVVIAIGEGEERHSVKISQLLPWFVPNDSIYAGFYEGLPGEDVALVIVNVLPTQTTLSVKLSFLDPESLEPREEEYLFTTEVQREENLLTIQSEEAPFSRAEFVRRGEQRGLLIRRKDGYAILWKRRF